MANIIEVKSWEERVVTKRKQNLTVWKRREPCHGWMDEEMIHRRRQIQQVEEPEENFVMLIYPSRLLLQ